MKIKWWCSQSCLTLATPRTVARQAPLSMGFSRQNTGVGCHFLLQRTSPTQGANPRLLQLLHCRQDSFATEPPGKPSGILCGHKKEWSTAICSNVMSSENTAPAIKDPHTVQLHSYGTMMGKTRETACRLAIV